MDSELASAASSGRAASEDSHRIRSLIATYPVTAFFVLAYAGTWTLHLPMVLGRDGLGLLNYRVPFPLFAALFITSSYSGPTLAAFVVTAETEGKEGCRRFLKRYGQWRVGFLTYFLVLFAYPLIYLAAAIPWMGLAPFRAFAHGLGGFFTDYLPALLIFPALITWGEEPGWRGFALTRMQERYSPAVASIIVGFFHGLWHLPVFALVQGPVALGPFSMSRFAINTLGIIAISVCWTWVFNQARQSLLVAVLLHSSGNAVQPLMLALMPDYPQDAGVVALAILAGLALLLIAATRGRLGLDRDGPSGELSHRFLVV